MLKIASGLPNSRSSFPAIRAPKPGVTASANHPKYLSGSMRRVLAVANTISLPLIVKLGIYGMRRRAAARGLKRCAIFGRLSQKGI